MMYKESTIKNFCKDYSLPIQIYSPEYMQYYIELYDSIFDTKSKWNMFTETVSKFESEDAFSSYRHKLISEILDKIKNLPEYKNFCDCKIEDMFPVEAEVCGVQYTKSTKLYNPHNSGNYFISIDLKTANYQALRFFDPAIVDNTKTYDEFIGRFTDIEYFCKAKLIRQMIFGNLNNGRITRIERWLTGKVLEYILQNNIYSADNIITFTTDEIIIQCDKYSRLDQSAIDNLQNDIATATGVIVSIDMFRLRYIGNNGYVKVHKDSPPVFKGISPTYFPQAYGAYTHSLLDIKAMHFSYEGRIAKFLTPVKWENI